MKQEQIFSSESHITTAILNGNELLIQGGLEAGFSLYTGYPGSPLADYFNILHHKKKEFEKRGIKVVIANSEANAAAMASGAKMAGKNTLVAMKSMGLHVAADALSVGNFANPGPVTIDPKTGEERSSGVVVAVGDDPWSISTSTPADSRYLFKHLHIPFLEPSTPQELKDWVKVALEISQRSSIYIGLILTTSMAEGGGRVQISLFDGEVKSGSDGEQGKEKLELNPKQFDLQKNVMVPPNSLLADREMIEKRFPRVEKILKDLSLDRVDGNIDSSLGFLSSGATAETLRQVMQEKGLLDRYSLYKLASSYPLVEDQLLSYLKNCQTLIIVEEKRGFLENEVRELCQRHKLNLEIFGKPSDTRTGFHAFGGLSYELIHEALERILSKISKTPSQESSAKSPTQFPKLDLALPPRYPTFCPGCPHRETLSLLKEIRGILEKENVQLISHGDVGCYSLSFLPPFKEMHDLSAMGQGGALGAGADIFIKNPSVVLMGDSTFYHSGISAISNSLQLNHNITYILLDNDNTAMTGHQMTPTSGVNVEGDQRPRQNIFSIVKAMGVQDILEVNPSDRYFYKNLLLSFIKKSGLKVIVSNKECGLTFHGRLKKQERAEFSQGKPLPLKSFYQINTEACEDCRACVEMTGCPGLSQIQDAYGTKVMIDPQICVSDSYCTMIKACPSFERIDVFNYHPTLYSSTGNEAKQNSIPVNNGEEGELPLPLAKINLETLGQGKDFRVVVTGVGGSGVTTISRVLAEAAKHMGGRDDLEFKFFDQKGLAQRNGSVTGFLSIFKKGKSHSTVIPKGTADLVLSPDLLEGARALDYLSPQGTAILDSEYQIPLSILLDRGIEKRPLVAEDLAKEILQKFPEQAVILRPLKKISQERFQRPVFASTLCLGLAFQSGKLPFSFEDLKTAITRAVPKDEVQNNLLAFEKGRRIFLHLEKEKRDDLRGAERESREGSRIKLLEKGLQESFFFSFGKNCQEKLELFRKSTEQLAETFPFLKREHLAQYIHDLILYDRGENLETFLAEASQLRSLHYNDEEISEILPLLAKTYFVKDEVYVAHLLVSPMRREEDQKRYAHLGESFRVFHINRPAFDIGSRKIEFDINPKDWMLKMVRHFRYLRKLLPAWHRQERAIAAKIRQEILEYLPNQNSPRRIVRLRELNSIKGYREVRYQAAHQYLK